MGTYHWAECYDWLTGRLPTGRLPIDCHPCAICMAQASTTALVHAQRYSSHAQKALAAIVIRTINPIDLHAQL